MLMKKVSITAISIIFIIILIIGLIGCGSIIKSEVSESPSSTISKTNETTSTDSSTAHVAVMPTKPSNIKATDYNQYLRKIWVVKSWNGGAYDYFSFFISKIENGVIEGKLSIGSIAYPDFYSYSLEPSKYLGDLSGTVNNDVADCRFRDKVGNKGNLTLVFQENDEINVKMKYTDKGEAYKDLSLDGNYLFRPYKLADIKYFIPDKEHSFSIVLNSWGSVKFISGEVDHGNKVYPAAYLINEHEDILYKFQAPFQTGFKTIEASSKDINNDGLKDVKITIGFVDDPNIERIEWIFYQMSNGFFYDSKLNPN